jgi:hypothetical protein
MKLRPLVLTETERALIRQVIDHAAHHVLNRSRIEKIIAGKEEPPGNTPEFTCVIPLGYRCVFTLEEQPPGICRHLSISVLGEGAAPNPEAVEALATEFGFRGGLTEMDAVYPETIAKNKCAVNLVQSFDAIRNVS